MRDVDIGWSSQTSLFPEVRLKQNRAIMFDGKAGTPDQEVGHQKGISSRGSFLPSGSLSSLLSRRSAAVSFNYRRCYWLVNAETLIVACVGFTDCSLESQS